MIKAIAVDFGGVYFNLLSIPETMVALQKLTGVSGEIVFAAMRKNMRKLHVQEMKEVEHVAAISKEIGVTIDPAAYLAFSDDAYFSKPNIEVVNLVKQLRKKHQIALFANQTVRLDRADERFHFYQEFDHVLSSHIVKQQKPDKGMFDLLLERTGVQPSEVLLIDDTQKNIDAAKALGMNAILFKDTEQLKNELRKYEVE